MVAKVLIDTGSDLTLVQSKYLMEDDINYEDQVCATGFMQNPIIVPTTNISIKIGRKKKISLAAVVDALPYDAILGRNAIEEFNLLTINNLDLETVVSEEPDNLEATAIKAIREPEKDIFSNEESVVEQKRQKPEEIAKD
ncbi:hypothetical protein TrispH2_008279 [Trichoplax sp. H2]|uniref:Peptidase A2 domain-containing protein n=1 Tax=Trichoplax adhaerens TaxID=10228 RepID=B3RN03_TRIAD|nr:predicted protein [Trichoplax adhaerens]EDV27933.1 predicted protein [Trichoplax adhaerens]RDD39849.1 hypothetical protein TrispH2_008279 [Trichoplax sp. H2]|eukprot:XP_002109767.1 predicted protein [Trichoplax adhaerens]